VKRRFIRYICLLIVFGSVVFFMVLSNTDVVDLTLLDFGSLDTLLGSSKCTDYEKNFIQVLLDMQSLPLDELRDRHVIAGLVRRAGLMQMDRAEYYGNESSAMIILESSKKRSHTGLKSVSDPGLQHIPYQLACALSNLATLGLQSFFEVGVHTGWNNAFFTAYLRRFARDGPEAYRSIGADSKKPQSTCILEVWRRLDIQFEQLYVGRESRYQLRGAVYQLTTGEPRQVDLCYVNDDHTPQGIRRDVDTVKDLCRGVMMHDIGDVEHTEGVVRQWREMASNKKETKDFWVCRQQPARENRESRTIGLGYAALIPPAETPEIYRSNAR